MLEAIDKLKL